MKPDPKQFKPKKTSRKAVVKKLDITFSRWIRARDNHTCVTCGKVCDPKQSQAGHYISRVYYSTRWSETNVHCQCYACNVCRHGAMVDYTIFMINRYGADYIQKMYVESKKTAKFSTGELLAMIERYSF